LINWEEVARRLGHPSEKEMWRDLYVVKRLTIASIAVRLGSNPATVRRAMAACGLQTRSGGGATWGTPPLTHEEALAIEAEGIGKAAIRLHMRYITLYKKVRAQLGTLKKFREAAPKEE
jgi:hypothetical protein